jgi:hypothetical protein
MYAAFETYLIDVTWVSRTSWKNDTDMMQTYSYSFTSGLTITKGGEVNKGFDLGAIYEGSSVTIDHEERVLKPSETGAELRISTISLTVPPHSLLIFYQRRYRFMNSIFFILDAQNKKWNILRGDNSTMATKECEVVIMSEDYATLRAQLTGEASINVKTVDGVKRADANKTLNSCTQKCKTKLWDMRI